MQLLQLGSSFKYEWLKTDTLTTMYSAECPSSIDAVCFDVYTTLYIHKDDRVYEYAASSTGEW